MKVLLSISKSSYVTTKVLSNKKRKDWRNKLLFLTIFILFLPEWKYVLE